MICAHPTGDAKRMTDEKGSAVRDGGAAFPHDARDIGKAPANGMSLRDYFAGQALNGMLAADTSAVPRYTAIAAYDFADAMLAARTSHDSENAAHPEGSEP